MQIVSGELIAASNLTSARYHLPSSPYSIAYQWENVERRSSTLITVEYKKQKVLMNLHNVLLQRLFSQHRPK